MDKSLENYRKWEDQLDGDTIYADPVADCYKEPYDAIDFIKQYIGSGWQSDSFYKDNINQIKADLKAGHEYLYYNNDDSSAFSPVSGMSVKDFERYDEQHDMNQASWRFKDKRKNLKYVADLNAKREHVTPGQMSLGI